jgi:hypothetical protein
MPPLSEDSLIHYATHCHKHLNLKYSTIKLYICGIRYKFLQFEIPFVELSYLITNYFAVWWTWRWMFLCRWGCRSECLKIKTEQSVSYNIFNTWNMVTVNNKIVPN